MSAPEFTVDVVLEPGHLPHPGQVHRRGHPQPEYGDAPVRPARQMAPAEQRADVEHLGRHDGRIPGPTTRSSTTNR
jgi:hypothetical protein